MTFNELPPFHKREQMRKTDFESSEEKLEYDAQNLIKISRRIGRRLCRIIPPDVLIRRQDDDMEELKAKISELLEKKKTDNIVSFRNNKTNR